MKKGIRRGIALLLSMVLVASGIQLPTASVRAEDSGIATKSSENSSEKCNILSISQEPSDEYFDLGEVETSAIPMSFFGLSDGNVELNSGKETNWIDRLDLTDAQVIRDLYDTLVEASDNDGKNDYLIDDSYFSGNHAITVATVEGTLEGTYSENDAKTEVSKVASELLAKYSKYMRAAYDAFDRDHPEVFWLDGASQSGYSYQIGMSGSGDAYTISYEITIQFILKSNNFDIRATNYQNESAIKTTITTVNNRVSELVNAVSGKTIEEQITYFNEQLTKTNEYNTSADLDNIGHDCRECTTALIGKTGTEGPVCESYARALKVLCDNVGIPCVLVDGQAKNSADSDGEAHMWNYVQVDSKWLAVDVTWNDPKGGASGAVSGVENTDWLLVCANSEIGGMTFIESHPVANQASPSGVGFTNGPELAVNTTKTSVVTTEAEFKAALADSSVAVIELAGDITLSRSKNGNGNSASTDDVFVIDRPVVITGNGSGVLSLERSGIILGADVTFKDMIFHFASPVRNAIFANGYALTIENVLRKEVASTVTAYEIDLFCGGITDYNGSSETVIPKTGKHGSITMKGTNTIGANVYAGSLSDVGAGVADTPNTYEGNATIVLEQGATGFSNIYAHGARENRIGGYFNEWIPNADLYKVSGNVEIYLNDIKNITIDGTTGGTKNVVVIYKDNGKGNLCTPTLKNVGSIQLIPADNGAIAYFAPITTQTSFDTLSVPENTRLSFINMGNEITASALEGGGELVFAEYVETTESASQKLILGSASGTTKVAVGAVDASDTGSTGNINVGWNCISVTPSSVSDYEFVLMPNSNNTNIVLEDDGNGNWTTAVTESSVQIQEIEVGNTFCEQEDVIITIPIQLTYATEDDANFIGDIPMVVTVNGVETAKESSWMGYNYFTGTTAFDLLMCFDFDQETDKEIIYIATYDTETDSGYIPASTYEISLTIPSSYMKDGKSKTLSFVLTVTHNVENTGDCLMPNTCSVCGKPAQQAKNHIDSNSDGKCDSCESTVFLIGAISQCLGNGTDIAHISMNPSNQLASANNTVTVTAPDMFGYTFKGWYLLDDIDNETNEIINGKIAWSTSFTAQYTPSTDVTLVAVYEAVGKADVTLSGSLNFTVTVNDGDPSALQKGTYTSQIAIGSKVTITVTDDNFINWVNRNKKIVTTEKTYTFIVTGENALTMSEKGTSGLTAMVEFVSAYNQVLAGQMYGSSDSISLPYGPSKMGHTFIGWSLTQDEIHAKIKAGETYIKVTPVYEQDTSVSYTVTVYVDGIVDDTQSVTGILGGSTKTVFAPSVEGKKFLYWTDENDTVLGYDTSYFMKINKNIKIYAVYGVEAVEEKPVIVMTNVFTTNSNGKHKLSFTATRDIPEGYVLVEHGMLYNVLGMSTKPTKDTFILGGTDVSKAVSNDVKTSGVLTVNMNMTGGEDIQVAARGYMIVKNITTNQEEIYYTDLIYTSYNDFVED